MEKNDKALEKVGSTPADLVRLAVEGNADVDKLEKLIALKERWDANEARKEYVLAMAEFHKNPPKILKESKVDFTNKAGVRTQYNYAKLAEITNAICKQLAENGLTVSWRTQENGKIIVTCRVTHAKGHFEETPLSSPPDDTGNKNKIQQVCSTVTYLQRYTLLSLVGLATYDTDDDGKSSEEVKYISDKQLSTLRGIVDNMKNPDKVRAGTLKFAKAESLDQILASDYKKVLNSLELTKKEQEAK